MAQQLLWFTQAIALDRGPLAFCAFLLRNPGPVAPGRGSCATEAQDASPIKWRFARWLGGVSISLSRAVRQKLRFYHPLNFDVSYFT